MKSQTIVISTVIVLLAASSAVAGPRQEPPEVWQAFAQKLEAGAFVKVHLKNGKKVTGQFIPSSTDTFRMKPKTRISVPIREFQFSEIQSIERKHESVWSPGMKALTGAGIGIGVAILIIIGAFAVGG